MAQKMSISVFFKINQLKGVSNVDNWLSVLWDYLKTSPRMLLIYSFLRK